MDLERLLELCRRMDETRERIRLKIPAPEVQSPPPPPLQAQPPVEPKPQEAPRPRSELMHMFVGTTELRYAGLHADT